MQSSEQPIAYDAMIKQLMADHAEAQTKLTAAIDSDADDIKIRRLKKNKLRIKDALQGYVKGLPQSDFAPTDPALFVLSDERLSAKLASAEIALAHVLKKHHDSSHLVNKARAEVRSFELEIGRAPMGSSQRGTSNG